MTPNIPLELVFVKGMAADELRAAIEREQLRWATYGGAPILPPGCEVTIVPIPLVRFEPDIEDTP